MKCLCNYIHSMENLTIQQTLNISQKEAKSLIIKLIHKLTMKEEVTDIEYME